VLHFVPEPVLAVGELRRVTCPGGVVAATVWDAGGGVTVNRLFCDTAAAVSPGGEAFRERIFGRPMTKPGELARVWRQTRFVEIEESTLTIRMEFESFDDYWAPYVGGDGLYAAFVSTLDESARDTLTEAVGQAYLSGMSDGPRSFAASAWAIRRHDLPRTVSSVVEVDPAELEPGQVGIRRRPPYLWPSVGRSAAGSSFDLSGPVAIPIARVWPQALGFDHGIVGGEFELVDEQESQDETGS
jgi:hypothetical protein